MAKLFSTCLLVQDGSNIPTLEITELSLHPGSSLSPFPDEKNILLAGGFTSIISENRFPLSSTLQLNHDLAAFGAEELTAIAQAELKRVNGVDYRSYTMEADNHVCVIGDHASQLTRFLDTYGGVLNIEPLLLKSYHPEFQTVSELTIDTDGKKCRLEYEVRSPIDLELCTYCGDCGPACPEDCISESLFIDYKACTSCRECEKVCESQAIDINGAVCQALEVPAVIVLGKEQLELPTESTNIFYEASLSDYFATLSPYHIDEVVCCDNSLCQYSHNLGGGCDLCLSSCPFGAIVLDQRGVSVDSFMCEECGGCVAVCPTGALQSHRLKDGSFVEYCNQLIIPLNGTIVIGEEQSFHKLWWQQQGKRFENTLFLHFDKVQGLSIFHLFLLLYRGARRIIVLEPDEGGSRSPASAKQLELAFDIVARLYDVDDAVLSCKVKDFVDVMAVPTAGSFGVALRHNSFVNRRQSLARVLEALVLASGREITLSPQGYIPFATVSCNKESCTQCMACLNDCRIGAMSADQQQLTLTHQAALCVGCGLCVGVCPENALRISSEFTLGAEFFAWVEMARAEPMICKSCGKVFGTKKSFERVMEILSSKESVDTSHFEYCDTCRVVKIFESE